MKKWIAFFSQTGTEIVDIAESLGRWPDMIITNERPDHVRTINPELLSKKVFTLPNKPSLEDYYNILEGFEKEDTFISLHGWLRVMPGEICEEYFILNGHPGLITEYPELKGKDPQIRAYQGIVEGKYTMAGTVIHRVTAGVDEGPIREVEAFSVDSKLALDELFRILRDRSLDMWARTIKKVLND